ncbi:hypothetical protein F1B92_03395 [Campylobacter sp. FMV-PI01]|uniref:Uncharacterized protein n=1 Tax=Campylobacter portucalensis TaxID=2608384 RepID=A0A6L5WJ12_9BACT|nr:hypothetical protein [Campylobacter portucalensis]MSN96247.1 hypothetical protein [Campylobacter portucalensis]
MKFKTQFLSFFRGIFLFNYRSLEFRSKIFASILLAKSKISKNDYLILSEISKEIYPNNQSRADILVQVTKEYIATVETYKKFSLDWLLKDIDRTLKFQKRYVKKINFEHLRRLISIENEDDALIQQRIYEFLISEVKIYSQDKR